MIKKLGLVLECGAGGPDEQVLKCLVKRLSPETVVKAVSTVTVKSRRNKEDIFNDGPEAARGLVELDGCDLVLIQWDLMPFWQGPPQSRNCVDETTHLLTKIEAFKPETQKKIKLLCLTHELETWMWADPAIICEYFSSKNRLLKMNQIRSFVGSDSPKASLDKLSKKHRGRRYNDYIESPKIARLWRTTVKLRKIQSFARFVNLLTGDENSEFLHDGTVCDALCHQSAMEGR